MSSGVEHWTTWEDLGASLECIECPLKDDKFVNLPLYQEIPPDRPGGSSVPVVYIFGLNVPDRFANKTLASVGLRRRFNLNAVAVEMVQGKKKRRSSDLLGGDPKGSDRQGFGGPNGGRSKAWPESALPGRGEIRCHPRGFRSGAGLRGLAAAGPRVGPAPDFARRVRHGKRCWRGNGCRPNLSLVRPTEPRLPLKHFSPGEGSGCGDDMPSTHLLKLLSAALRNDCNLVWTDDPPGATLYGFPCDRPMLADVGAKPGRVRPADS